MAIKIITRGVAPKDVVYHRKCIVCGTVFHYQMEDLCYDAGNCRESKVKCPVCDEECGHQPDNIVEPED